VVRINHLQPVLHVLIALSAKAAFRQQAQHPNLQRATFASLEGCKMNRGRLIARIAQLVSSRPCQSSSFAPIVPLQSTSLLLEAPAVGRGDLASTAVAPRVK
jgi:hypothetical protein